jgi:hypothetical protein
MPCIIVHGYRQGAPPDVPVRGASLFVANNQPGRSPFGGGSS